MENKYVYWDNNDYHYKEIDEEYINRYKEYFSNLDDRLNENNEIVFYKLVPYKTLKKKVNYELE